MTEYLVLWLSVLVFVVVGILTNIVFFRSGRQKKVISKRDSLDSVLFEASRK